MSRPTFVLQGYRYCIKLTRNQVSPKPAAAPYCRPVSNLLPENAGTWTDDIILQAVGSD